MTYIGTVCPHCEIGISVDPIERTPWDNGVDAVFCKCPLCYKAFIALVKWSDPFDEKDKVLQTFPSYKAHKKDFDSEIVALSERFCNIYKQAMHAEEEGLDEIAGMGYRKALEILIKDFLISKCQTAEGKEKIKKMELGNCIANKIDNPKLETVASRSAWLGNDFSHYTVKFQDKDISDLKHFIEATMHWILMELYTDEAATIDSKR